MKLFRECLLVNELHIAGAPFPPVLSMSLVCRFTVQLNAQFQVRVLKKTIIVHLLRRGSKTPYLRLRSR